MAYADRSQSGNRTVAIIVVAILLAALGYAFVTGLAYQYVKKVANKMNTFDVAPPPPPPPPDVPPPPPPPEQQVQPPPVVSPPPIVQTVQSPVQISTVQTPPPKVVLVPPPPPAPPPPRVSKAAGAKGNPSDWITTDDYPSSALRADEEGTVTIAWTINTEGRVENCHTVSSSGHADLDEAACRALTRHARYKPALDQNGNPISSTQSRRVVWRIPD
jgi:protein TonB